MQKSQESLAGEWGFWQDHWDHIEGLKVQSLNDLGVATSVNEFWNLYEKFNVSQLSKDCSLHIFRKHVKPEWEDPANVNGGHFRLLANMSTDLTSQQRKIGHLWFDLVRAVVREDFDDAKSVVGIAFTNKSYRQVISVWTTTNDPSVVATVQHNLLQHAQDDFAIKFVPHKRIARSDFTTKQTRLHRRTTSAPVKYLNVDSDDDVDAGSPQAQLGGGSSLLARRGVNAEGLAKDGLSQVNTVDTPPPQQPSSTVKFADDIEANDSRKFGDMHQRSKSEGQSRSIIPGNPRVASRQESESLSKQNSTAVDQQHSGAFDNALKSSDSGPLFTTPQIAAPSPMKDWSVGWSPSLLQTGTNGGSSAQQQALLQKLPPPPSGQQKQQSQPAPSNYPPAFQHQLSYNNVVTGQQPQVVPVGPPGPISGGTPPSHPPVEHVHHFPPPVMPAYIPTAQYQHQPTMGHQQPPVQHQQVNDRIIIGTVKAPTKTKPPPKVPEPAPAPAAPAPVPVKSDSAAFVSNGWLYPPGLNRKERRKILFAADGFEPTEVKDVVFVGTDVPDGGVETSAEYEKLQKLGKTPN